MIHEKKLRRVLNIKKVPVSSNYFNRLSPFLDVFKTSHSNLITILECMYYCAFLTHRGSEALKGKLFVTGLHS